MNERIAALVERNRRDGYSSEVTIRHQPPQPRRTRKQQREIEASGYSGWTPEPRVCRREGCEKVFLPKTPPQAYCTVECKQEAERAQRRQTAKGQRERAARQSEGLPPQTRTCGLEGCDHEFVPKSGKSRYCSPEHSAAAARKNKQRSAAKQREAAQRGMTDTTRAAIEQIELLESRQGEKLPELAREYLVKLWQLVNDDPQCPEHVYDRLERLLGLPPAVGSTMPAADG